MTFRSMRTIRTPSRAEFLLTRPIVAKDVLKTRLQWVIASHPQANPSRTTLKRVNDFLLSPFSDPSTLGIPRRTDGLSGLDERDGQPIIADDIQIPITDTMTVVNK